MKKGVLHSYLIMFLFFFASTSAVDAQTSSTTLSGTENATRRVTTNAVVSGNYTIGTNGFVVVNGDLTINSGATVTVNGTLIVEGDLIMNTHWWYGDSELNVGRYGVVSVKKQLKGSGGTLTITTQNQNQYGTIAINKGVGSNGSFTVSKDGQNNNKVDYGDAFYIDGATLTSWYSSESESLSNTSSDAYANSVTVMEKAADEGLLPIELTSFTVSATEHGYTFNWITSSEVNNDYFTLEYSIDGVNFNEIDYVHGAGTTSETSEYEYRWDEAPEFDVVYFRLKQTDYNGEYTYSDVIAASHKKSSGANGTFRYGPLNLQIQDGELRYIVK